MWLDNFTADREGRQDLITEFDVVQYDDDNDNNKVNNMYWCNITSNVHKTDIITFLHILRKTRFTKCGNFTRNMNLIHT